MSAHRCSLYEVHAFFVFVCFVCVHAGVSWRTRFSTAFRKCSCFVTVRRKRNGVEYRFQNWAKHNMIDFEIQNKESWECHLPKHFTKDLWCMYSLGSRSVISFEYNSGLPSDDRAHDTEEERHWHTKTKAIWFYFDNHSRPRLILKQSHMISFDNVSVHIHAPGGYLGTCVSLALARA